MQACVEQQRETARKVLPWIVRASLVIVFLNVLYPPSPRAPLGPPQKVETQQDHVCVHTRLIDEVEEWKIQLSLIHISEPTRH